ncbi:phosphomannomutase, partial [bacterium]|nr:phosphomannomutase [bacterium]
MNPEIFRAYDIRGVYPKDINKEDINLIAKSYVYWLRKNTGKDNLKIAIGRDVRLSGEKLMNSAIEGLTDMGVEVKDVGIISTDMLYFAVANYGFDGGLVVTASHNPGEYNGMKVVREESRPISSDTGLQEIRDLAFNNDFINADVKGTLEKLDIIDDYVNKMITFAKKDSIEKFKILVNPNFGAAGRAIQKIADYYDINLVKLNFDADGNFPKGQPDPLLTINRQDMKENIEISKPDFAVTWDADADRCMFYDENGAFVQPVYITGILMDYFLENTENECIVTDPRLIWLPTEIAKNYNARIAINKSGHSFIKDRMREENAIFGAETSAHYYFKDLWYTDNGMLPFIIVMKIASAKGKKFSELIAEYRAKSYTK